MVSRPEDLRGERGEGDLIDNPAGSAVLDFFFRVLVPELTEYVLGTCMGYHSERLTFNL